MKLLAPTLFLLLLSIPLLAQRPGELDTTFRVRANYGPNKMPKKTYLAPDGSIFLYAPNALFSGQKVGPLIKLKPNGDPDTSFVAPEIGFQYSSFCDWPGCEGPGDGEFYPAPDGSVYCKGDIESSPVCNGIAMPHLIRLLPSGKIDTAFHFPQQLSSYAPFYLTPDSKMLVQYDGFQFPKGTYRLFSSGRIDTSFHSGVPSTDWTGMASNLKGDIVELVKTDSSFYYRRYDSALNSFSAPYGSTPIGGTLAHPESRHLIALSASGHTYEMVSNDTLYVIQKLKPDGTPDTSYKRIKIPDSKELRFNELGMFSFIPSFYSPNWIYRHDSSGHFLDSIPPDRNHTGLFIWNNTLIEIGADIHNRWSLVKKDMAGQVLLNRNTRHGLNGEVTGLLQEPDGSLVVAGSFTEYDAFEQPLLLRIKPNGEPDTTFRVPALSGTKWAKAIYLDRFSNGDFLLATESKEGKHRRFLHRIRPDGSVDTLFGVANLSDFNKPVKQIKRAVRSSGGKIWVVLKSSLFFGLDTLIRLLPDGSKDTGFEPFVTTGGYRNVMELKSMGSNTIQLCVEGSFPSGPVPDYYSEIKALRMTDTTDSDQPDFMGRYWMPYSFNLPYFIPLRWKSEVIFDKLLFNNNSSFQLSDSSGGPIERTYSVEGNMAGITKDQEIVYATRVNSGWFHNQGIRKMNFDGVVDTAFVTNETVGDYLDMVEPDSLHVYLFGDLVQYGNQPLNYLCRIHNRRSEIQLSKESTVQASQVLLYPNPAHNEVTLSLSGPSAEVVFYNAQGRLWHKADCRNKGSISVQSWPRGVYFWRATDASLKVNSGKLIKE